MRKKLALKQSDIPKFSKGSVWIVGAGPGRIGNSSLACLVAISEADIIVHDALINPALLRYKKANAEIINIGRRANQVNTSKRSFINTIDKFIKEDKKILRLKGGDISLFAKLDFELTEIINAKIPFILWPGISAHQDAAASLALPLTNREKINFVYILSSFSLGKNLQTKIDWSAITNQSCCIVLYMGYKIIGKFCQQLISKGRNKTDKIYIAIKLGLKEEKIISSTIYDVAKNKLGTESNFTENTPAIIIIGPHSYNDKLAGIFGN